VSRLSVVPSEEKPHFDLILTLVDAEPLEILILLRTYKVSSTLAADTNELGSVSVDHLRVPILGCVRNVLSE